MGKMERASNLHLPSQFTFSSTFPQTPVLAQSCRPLTDRTAWEGRLYILNLTPFFASRPKADKHFLQPPNWGHGCFLGREEGSVALSHSRTLIA